VIGKINAGGTFERLLRVEFDVPAIRVITFKQMLTCLAYNGNTS